MSKKLYLVTGAAGYLGSNIVRSLTNKNKKVRAFVLKGDPAKDRLPKEVDIFQGDIRDYDSLYEFFNAEDDYEIIVLHCAAIVTLSPDYNEDVYTTNVLGTKNILKKCVESKAQKLVYVSSTSAIPEIPGKEIIKEVDSFDPNLVIGYYAKTKAEATQAVLDAVKNNDLDASIVFPTGITGPGDYSNGLMTNFMINYLYGKMPALIEGSFNAVDVRDLARGVILCSEKGRKGEGYIMSNSIVSMDEFCSIISMSAGVPKIKTILSVPVAKAMASILSIQSKITKKPSILTSFAIYNLSRNNNFSSQKAESELGYGTRDFNVTIKDMINWLEDENLIESEDERDLNKKENHKIKKALLIGITIAVGLALTKIVFSKVKKNG